jgi:F0F1-type ATP synthase membrane subunit b/b'
VSGWPLEALVAALRAELERARTSTGRRRREAIELARMLAVEVRHEAEGLAVRTWLEARSSGRVARR